MVVDVIDVVEVVVDVFKVRSLFLIFKVTPTAIPVIVKMHMNKTSAIIFFLCNRQNPPPLPESFDTLRLSHGAVAPFVTIVSLTVSMLTFGEPC